MMEDDRYLKEWATTRELLGKYDDKIHDLRKYGFSFITALLTAQALLIRGDVNPLSDSTVLPDFVKAVVIGITILLILALAFFEKNYKVIQEAAVERALILEKTLNLELTESISYVFKNENAQKYKFYVYVLFVLGANLLAIAIIIPYSSIIPFTIYMTILMLASIFSLLLIKSNSQLSLKSKICAFVVSITGINIIAFLIIIPYFSFIPSNAYIGVLVSMSIIALFLINHIHIAPKKSVIDWSIDRVKCKKGDLVAITLNNLSETSHRINKGPLFQIVAENNLHGKPVYEIKDFCCEIGGRDSYTWLWNTDNSKVKVNTIYRIIIPQYHPNILKRKIRVE
ncbi:hypothetical protein [Methanobacterium formicicum]|uniref:hypothetical protein n=1 Tax=Methanobacterium formicicum TaxID=2162 RepID=UPI002412D934|nr:hypothetical protein [Methanobacterium formicicum]